MPYVFSTLSNDQIFNEFEAGQKHGPLNILRQVHINGKANIATKNLITPLGVATKVTDDELAFLESDSEFMRFAKEGFIKVTKMKTDADKAVRDMTSKDQSAPLTPLECEQGSKRMPKIEPAKAA